MSDTLPTATLPEQVIVVEAAALRTDYMLSLNPTNDYVDRQIASLEYNSFLADHADILGKVMTFRSDVQSALRQLRPSEPPAPAL